MQQPPNDYGLNHLAKRESHTPYDGFLGGVLERWTTPESEKKLNREQQKVEIERKRAENEMIRNMNTEDNSTDGNSNTLLIAGGVAVATIIIAVLLFRKPSSAKATDETLDQLIK